MIEQLECEQSIYVAVEVTAGNRLFHHNVEGDRLQPERDRGDRTGAGTRAGGGRRGGRDDGPEWHTNCKHLDYFIWRPVVRELNLLGTAKI